jgi:hypothetical protein
MKVGHGAIFMKNMENKDERYNNTCIDTDR